MHVRRKRKKYRLRNGVKLFLKFFLISLLILILVIAGFRVYRDYFSVQVQVAHIQKPKPPVSSRANSSKTAKKIKVISDDWNYIDGNISIKIRESQEGVGKGMVTMFIADVTLNNFNYLHTAFAKNEFGMHITQKVTQIAQDNNALFAVNGDYYGYRNNGIIVRNGVLYRDNPMRDMLALFKNGTMSIINERSADIKALMSAGLLDSFSFGPTLVKDGKMAGGLTSVFRDQWYIQGLDPRTGVGYISPNHFVFIIVDGRKPYYSRGLTLTEFANEFISLGCTEAYNLDGGGSSTMYFKERIVNSPLGENGNYERNVSDIIYIDNPASNQTMQNPN